MKKILIAVLAATVLWQAKRGGGNWLTDLPQAQAQAKAENKIVLLDFTGSDWCGWCIKFKKEVLDTQAFQDYAAKNVVLVEVDFPNKKDQTADLKKANAALKESIKSADFRPWLCWTRTARKSAGRWVMRRAVPKRLSPSSKNSRAANNPSEGESFAGARFIPRPYLLVALTEAFLPGRFPVFEDGLHVPPQK